MSDDLWHAGVHEAAQAVIGRVLGLVCGEITLETPEHGGVGHAHVECRWKLPSRDRVRKALADAFCIALYAGAEAERVFFAIEPDGDEIDRERATQALCKVGVRGARFVGDEVWEKHEAKLRRKARILVQEERARIERVAQGLVKHKTLTSEEVDCL